MQLTLIFIVVLLCSTKALVVGSFAWKADLDQRTGVACSHESSSWNIQDDVGITTQLALKKSNDFVVSWVEFLCRGNVTFGIFQARTSLSQGTTSLHFRGVPKFSILTFGTTKQRSVGEWDVRLCESWLAREDPGSPGNYGGLRFRIKWQGEKKDSKFHLESQIVGYRPWLAGETPVSSFRKFLYLNTQSRLHAHLVRRFHREWRENILTDR